MSAGSAQGEASNGGGGWATAKPVPERKRPATTSHAQAYDYALTYAHARAYVSLAMKASGLLALLLSTVVLLGGYVQSLGAKDFFCITVISAIQAAGIFKHWENNVQYLMDFIGTTNVLLDKLIILTTNFSVKGLFIACLSILVSLFLAVAMCIQLIYLLGPFACAAVSSWRMAKLNHGSRDGTDIMANMMAALNIFYSLIIFQGAMFGVLLLTICVGRRVVASHLHALEQLPEKWGKEAIHRYLNHISAKCRKDPLSVKGMDMIRYAAELVDSESQQDYLHGARLLSAFIKKGEDVRWLLLPSTHRIQKLVDSLWISSSSSSGSLDDNTEIRELAAMIVAGLAAHIDVARYPGALRYICSLFQEETTQTHWNSTRQAASDPQPSEILRHPKEEQTKNLNRREEERQWRLMRDQKRLGTSQEQRRQNNEGRTTTSNKLILQGLTILSRLAANSDNRRLICSTPGLLPKITAPLYSETLIQDVKTKAWADIVTRCLKVLCQLIHAPAGWTSRMLRHQISSDDQALINLKSILLELGNNEADHQELQLVAMKILTELALDLSINLTEETKKVLVTKQLQLFLLANGENGEESATMAGRTLVSLSTNSESNSNLIKATQDDIVGRLTGILDDENTTRSAMAAQIMANLCAHCNVDSDMKEIMRKVLRKIMSTKTKSQERKTTAGENNPVLGDEENQGNSSVSTKDTEERLKISTQDDDTEIEEISGQEREEQEAFLSLAQVICDKLNGADLDGAIQSAVNKNSAGSEERRREAFVGKLKTIIDNNCQPAVDSLRIVKLCCRIAKSVMQCEQYKVIFRNRGFKSRLSKASKTMSELESCMLFVGTDFGPKKTVRPLFSEIEESFGQI